MTNYEQLQLLMDEHMETKNGWLGLKPSTDVEDDNDSICLHCTIAELQQSNEDLASEVYALKGAVEHLIRMLGGK